MEVQKEQHIKKVEYKCPKCLNGMLLPTGLMYMTYPAKYPHKCTDEKCKYQEVLNELYPKIVFEDK
ncbi:hypothetical protein [Paenibacillus naphthalenovorans]|uniref:Uncharacterized protein n=1 Tax=Paenibacillus naphthalenovorans TaxID=162209 RepID=A0A0U2M3W0_9BACL|nr:hypothetical protein [Paenibacillus naphthalenovorans]ALS22144.1 hypothetical protein IJ22_17700 [Paenibacillus naphthalenovorans]